MGRSAGPGRVVRQGTGGSRWLNVRLSTVALIGVGLILAAVLGWAVASGRIGGGSSEPGAIVVASPTPPPDGPTDDGSATAEATPSPASAGESPGPATSGELALLYSHFGENEDTLWLAPASQLQEAEALATIAHASFWGISASLSPDGRWVAYTALPSTVPNPEEGADAQAQVWAQPVAGGEPQLLASDADVRLAPIWSPDSGALVFQRFDRRRNASSLFRVNLQDKVVSPLTSLEGATSVLPVAFGPGGDLLYAVRIAEGGTQLLATSIADGSVQTIATIASGIARDWQLSPDGRRMAFVKQAAGGEWELWVLDLEDGSLLRLEAEGLPTDRELFSPIWHPGQGLITLGTAPGDDGNGVLSISLAGQGGERLPGPAEGFDIPVAWSPNGDSLVVQQFSEYPVQRRPSLYLLTTGGERQRLAEGSEVTFVGWLASAE